MDIWFDFCNWMVEWMLCYIDCSLSKASYVFLAIDGWESPIWKINGLFVMDHDVEDVFDEWRWIREDLVVIGWRLMEFWWKMEDDRTWNLRNSCVSGWLRLDQVDPIHWRVPYNWEQKFSYCSVSGRPKDSTSRPDTLLTPHLPGFWEKSCSALGQPRTLQTACFTSQVLLFFLV